MLEQYLAQESQILFKHMIEKLSSVVSSMYTNGNVKHPFKAVHAKLAKIPGGPSKKIKHLGDENDKTFQKKVQNLWEKSMLKSEHM